MICQLDNFVIVFEARVFLEIEDYNSVIKSLSTVFLYIKLDVEFK